MREYSFITDRKESLCCCSSSTIAMFMLIHLIFVILQFVEDIVNDGSIIFYEGKIKKVNSINVTAYVNGRKKTFKLKSSQYRIMVENASEKIVTITGKKDFSGSAAVKTK
ncbi:MAG: hypothetical protein J6O55_05165 [Lachnospiraceae bacterium]|nr:hypothetical protein [Lachnospiraceae bacterium]